MFLFKKNRQLREKVTLYAETGGRVVDGFLEAIRHYQAQQLTGLEAFVPRTHEEEHSCDTIRRDIERELFEKSLLPDMREDICALLERLDQVMNQAEDVILQIVIQQIRLPAEFQKDYGELAQTCHEACSLVLDQVMHAFEHDSHARDYARQVGDIERRGDAIEHRLIKDIFSSSLSLAEKQHYRDLVRLTGSLADLAEDVADWVLVFRIKREI